MSLQFDGKMPIICMPWTASTEAFVVRVETSKIDQLDKAAGRLLMAINHAESKYRFFDEDGRGLDLWTHLDFYYSSHDTLRLGLVLVSAYDIRKCKASAENRARFFSELIAAARTVEITYPRDDPVVLALLDSEAGEEIRRLLCNVVCAYRAGVMQTMMFEFFTGADADDDCRNPRLTIKGPGAGVDGTPTERWDAIFDVKTGHLRRASLDVILTDYRHACRSEQAVLLQLPAIDYSTAGDRGRNDIRVWRDDEVLVLLHDCGFAVPVAVNSTSPEEERRLSLILGYDVQQRRARYGLAFLLTCDARKMDACLEALKRTGYLPQKYWLERAPVNHIAEFNDVKDAREVFFDNGDGGGSLNVNWKPMPLYKHRFYEKFARLVEFVLAMHTLALPATILNELALWTKNGGSHLLRADRMRAIESTLASCTRVREARAQQRASSQKII